MDSNEILTYVFYSVQHGELLPDGMLRVPVVEHFRGGRQARGYRDIGPQNWPSYNLLLRLWEEKSEDIDLFDGFGNGSLHFKVWLDRYIGLDFHPVDWQALFIETLGCPPYDPCQPEEDGHQCQERNRRRFQAAIPQYPLLGCIFDMYEDALFSREEVPPLREECQRAKAQAVH